MLTRRQVTGRLCAAIGVYGLIETTKAGATVQRAASAGVRRWIERQQQITSDLRAGTLDSVAWQEAVEQLAGDIDLEELLKQTDFERLRASFDFAEGMPSKRIVRFPKDSGYPNLRYGLAFFGFRRGDVITPHGHRNMVSAHMVVAGSLRVRNYDRVRDEDSALVLRPTVDERIGRGTVSTMSSRRNNIHWFVAGEHQSATLDVVVDALESGQDPYTIDLVDPLGGQALGDGTVRAPFISWETSVAKYA